jgi:hypothetical protein
MKPKFPNIEVQLSGEDGNAFFIIGRVSKALKKAGHIKEAEKFRTEAMDGDYDDLLITAMKYVNCL